MGGAPGLCQLCPPMRRSGRNRSHRDDPVAWCADCNSPICTRHVRWRDDRWLCARCDRTAGKGGTTRADA